MSTLNPSGIITITTDFGHKGPFVGVMKGQILSRFRSASIIDLSHDIMVHWPAEAGFWVARCHRYFPPGTVHCCVVDPGVGTERNIIAVAANGHLFLAPDNGLLAPVIDAATDACIVRIGEQTLTHFGLHEVSATFHGRDIFAPLAAELAAGHCDMHALGEEVSDYVPGWLETPRVTATRVEGVVVTIDTFGNLITNIDASMIAPMHTPTVQIAGHELPLLVTYANAEPGRYLALVNSFGVVEIAQSQDSASESLGVNRGAPVVVCAR